MNMEAPTLIGGRLERHTPTWLALVGNRLEDPPDRSILIYLPNEYDRDPHRRFPVVYVLHGYTMSVESWLEPDSIYGRYLPDVDALIADGSAPAVLLVFLDGWNKFGGSQYVDSPGSGQYLRYLSNDVVPWVDERFRTLSKRDNRGIQGHSSGGFGALHTAYSHPELFSAVAASAPDALYEVLYPPVFANVVLKLRESQTTFDQWQRGEARIEDDSDLQMCLGVAACFSPGDDGQPVLPFDPATGKLINDAWSRWLELDPVRFIDAGEGFPTHVSVSLSVGSQDEFRLDVGAVALEHLLRRRGVPVVLTVEPTDHGGIVKEMPPELIRLARAITP